MIVVSDTSPINDLLRIDQIDLLPRLFKQITVPDVVLGETLPADLLIIDERLGRQTACDLEIPIIGTLGILDNAATQGLIDLAETIAQLQQTNFRVSRRVIQALIEKQIKN